MKYIIGQSREQMAISSLEAIISQDNTVRTIDLFVDSLDVEKLGFKVKTTEEGRPAYHPKDLLKLYLYGYLNRIRSSRQLEKECYRNIELMWLLKDLKPDHNTISNFRRDNPDGIREVFRAAVSLAKFFKLIGAKLLAGDSVKLRAQNSKKNNFNEKKIKERTAYIDRKLAEYEKALAEADSENKKGIEEQIITQKERKVKYEVLQRQLDQTEDTQISTSDPDSRQLPIHGNTTEVAYSIQVSTDALYNLPIDYNVTNENDCKAMGEMLSRAIDILKTNEFTGLFDKGYHNGAELEKAEKLEVEVMVASPDNHGQAPDPAYEMGQFVYNEQNDTYTCPQGNTLQTDGKWHDRDRRKSVVKVKYYTTSDCKTCPFIHLCTKRGPERGRIIERTEYAHLIEKNRQRIAANKGTYKRRQSIVEHPFGTIKRQWGFTYIMTKRGKKRASADVGLIFTAYLLRRLMNILKQDEFREHLKALCPTFLLEKLFKTTLKALCNHLKGFRTFRKAVSLF